MPREIAFEIYQEMKSVSFQECIKTQLQECFVTGHDFSRAAKAPQYEPALAAAIVRWLKTNPAGAEAQNFMHFFGTTEVVPCYKTFKIKIFPQFD